MPGVASAVTDETHEGLTTNDSDDYEDVTIKIEFALLQTLLCSFYLFQFKCCKTFWQLKSNGLYQSSGKGKENCLAFTSSTKREIIRHFHFVVMQLRQRNVEKSVIHVQSCCFETYCFFAFLVAVAVDDVKAQVSSLFQAFR